MNSVIPMTATAPSTVTDQRHVPTAPSPAPGFLTDGPIPFTLTDTATSPLDLQREAITDVRAAAEDEPDNDRRASLLALAQRAETAIAETCPISWCMATGEHRTHYSATIDIPAPSAWPQDGPYLGAYLIDGGDGKVTAGLDAGTWLDLDSAGLRTEAAKIRTHSVRLEALADRLATIENEQDAPAPEPVGARTWTVTIDGHHHITGYETAWCQADHGEDINVGKLGLHMVDFAHYADFEGAPLHVFTPGAPEDGGGVNEEQVFRGNLTVQPFAEEAERRTPHVSLEVVQDFWIDVLGPDELAGVIGKLRAQLDRLDDVHAQLVAARADWAVQQ